MRKIKVLHIITRMCDGGAQKNTLLNTSLVNTDYFDSQLISGPSTDSEGDILDLIKSSGITFTEIPELTRTPSPLKDFIAYRKLSKFIRANKFDIVHTHTSKAGILGRWAAWWNKVPVIVHSSHANIFYGYFNPLFNFIFINVERMAANISHSLQELTELGVKEHKLYKVGKPDRFQVVYSGQDLTPYLTDPPAAQRQAIRTELGLSPEHLAIICIARLAPIKDHKTLITAFQTVLKKIPHARLLLVGIGDMEQQLKQQVQELNLGDAVIFTGLRKDIPDLLHAADIFAMTSLNEGMGRALVEASASKLPCVSTTVGGIPEVILHEKTGLLVASGDSDATAVALIRMLQDQDLRLTIGTAGREHAHPKFSIENMIATIEQDYFALIKRHHPDAAQFKFPS